MKVAANNIEELFEHSGKHKETMEFLDQLIQEMAPQLDRKFYPKSSITMIGYGALPYVTKTVNSEWPVICLAPQKATCNLYISATKDGKYLTELYADKLGKVSCGKSCIRIKKLEHLDMDNLKALINETLTYYQERQEEA